MVLSKDVVRIYFTTFAFGFAELEVTAGFVAPAAGAAGASSLGAPQAARERAVIRAVIVTAILFFIKLSSLIK